MIKRLYSEYEERAKDILSKMTLDDKLLQMSIYADLNKAYEEFKETGKIELRAGTFHNPENVKNLDELQDYCVNKTKLGIPLLPATESLHGVQDKDATVFPQCAGLGCSFDREKVYKMADIIGNEARAKGIRQVYAPCVDIPRDPRFGRMQESYGEDPYLVGEMGAQYVKAIQKHGVAATAKHFIAYGFPEGGINLATAHIGERELREVMLEPFKKLIDAGVMSIMPSYNEIDGEPVHSSVKYLRRLLRDELGFDGVVVSDYGAVEMLHSFHKVAKDDLSAGKMAINAGVDIEAPRLFGYGDNFKNAVLNGEIDEKLIDEAVLDILVLKLKVGLFENPYTDTERIKRMHSKKAVDLALKLDEESILLLENDGILPLDENKINKVAVIGNNGKESSAGDYIDLTENCVDFYSGMVNRLGENRVLYAKGCNAISYTDEMIEEAVDVAKNADVVFLVLGDQATVGGGIAGAAEKNKEVTCGEGFDMHTLELPPSQRKLFDKVTELNKPTVLILYAGRPYTLENDIKKVNAFMFSFGGGEQSGNAFANLIFGDKSPSAKLSVSFPKSVGHIPCYYNYKPSARGSLYKRHGSIEKPGRDYVLSSPNAWYSFGYGLSYTTLLYSDLYAEKKENGSVKVSVNVENTGNYDINESVLLFVKAVYSPITPFVKRLRNFKKVNIKSKTKETVDFILTEEDFTYVDFDYKTSVLKGKYKIIIDKLECDIDY